MEAGQSAQDAFNIIFTQLMEAVQSSGLQIIIAFCLTFIIQKVKMTVYFFSKRLFLFQLLCAAIITAFYVYFTEVEVGMIPVLFIGYLGLPVFFYYVFKKMKLFKGAFKSNYEFLKKEDEKRGKEAKRDKRENKKSK